MLHAMNVKALHLQRCRAFLMPAEGRFPER
uniref:Uncharacterized protein n=1 Tax=Myoviridae sp. ctq8k5 TaxID=2826701 RepID=A0A8S5QYM8_9CAUD|nr:MAG TPA: hypothetical protein [Myoviridae sp. ctq8k5]DAK93396.1 MAG TPA: hypothetical protein [Caudoviricetes sp.]